VTCTTITGWWVYLITITCIAVIALNTLIIVCHTTHELAPIASIFIKIAMGGVSKLPKNVLSCMAIMIAIFATNSQALNEAHKCRRRAMALVGGAVPTLKLMQTTPIQRGVPRGNLRRHLKKMRIALAIINATLMVHALAKQRRLIIPRGKFDTDSSWVGVDCRASYCISCDRRDFPGELKPCSRSVEGFGGALHYNVWIGTLVWTWDDDEGMQHTFSIPNSYYIPDGKVKLLSPQHWVQSQRGATTRRDMGSITNGRETILFWNRGRCRRTIPLDVDGNNVATYQLSSGYTRYQAYCQEINTAPQEEDANPLTREELLALDAHIIPNDEESETSSPPIDDDEWENDPPVRNHPRSFDINGPGTVQDNIPDVVPDEEDQIQENPVASLLRYHYNFGHISFAKLQEMAKRGILPTNLATCHVPICSACQYAKATKRPWRGKPRKDFAPSRATKPGEVVSVDQLVSPTPGLIAQMTGFITKERYNYATVYVDQATGHGYVYLQKTPSAQETLESKRAFERYALSKGVVIQAYHADNGIFKAYAWVDACNAKRQQLTFTGVGAHHSNGMAERRIRELQDLARTALIHANRRWPDAINAHLWPYALLYANDCINAAPSMQDGRRRSPLQQFTGSTVDINPKHWKPFGCPVYVLNAPLQTNKPHNKWASRARVGIYLGQSPVHNRNVALVLDRYTGHVSPQFHVKVDPGFYTLKQETLPSYWQVSTFFERPTAGRRGQVSPASLQLPKKQQPTSSGGNPEGDRSNRQQLQQPNTILPPHPEPEGDGDSAHNNDQPTTNEKPVDGLGIGTPAMEDSPQEYQRKSQRTTKKAKHLNVSGDMTRARTYDEPRDTDRRPKRTAAPVERLTYAYTTEMQQGSHPDAEGNPGIQGEIYAYSSLFPHDDSEGAPDLENPLLAYKASTDPDTMYMHEAMREPDREEFKKAMEKEVHDQMENGNFSIIKRQAVPKGKTILPAVWQMKRKRDILTREIKKYKARLNIDGSRMRYGEHYDLTYSPVASWTSVKLLLALALVHNWHTTQLDYVLAYPQAPVEREIYMEIPKGFAIPGAKRGEHVLKIHRNIYGQKQAGRVWNQYLVRKLTKEVGFSQSKVDECVFYRGNVMYVLYTDDSILAGPTKAEVDKAIEDIKKAKLNITVEGDIKDFLGVNIHKQDDGGLLFCQPHLIDKILTATKLDGDKVAVKDTPAASSRILHRHSASEDFDKSFNYRSVIGMLNYLEKATRSDIAYAAHQCARFVDNPKKEHGAAVRWLVRYLKGTRDKGTVYRPDPSRILEVYVDSDFAGNWNRIEASTDRDTARSRHGYIIMYNGCPIVHKSQLQTEIALSSTEAEYTGLSYALREAIPIMHLLEEIKSYGIDVATSTPQVKCKVFEDNSGALEMAKVHKYRPRTKHINVKLHHFRSFVESGQIEIHPISTHDNFADYLTKPLNALVLEPLRRAVMGW
jgi:hypothetical protein